MNRLMSKMACAVLGLSLGCVAYASPTVPVSMAPAKPNSIIIITGPRVVVIVTRPAQQSLQKVDQAAQFDRTN
jgi:hypothetical protein